MVVDVYQPTRCHIPQDGNLVESELVLPRSMARQRSESVLELTVASFRQAISASEYKEESGRMRPGHARSYELNCVLCIQELVIIPPL